MSYAMFWNALVIIATLTGFAGVALVVGKRWGETAVARFDRLERGLEDTCTDVAEATTFMRLRMEVMERQIADLDRSANRRATLAERLIKTQSSQVVSSTRKSIAKDLATTFTQLEALQNLYAIAPPDRPIPSSRNWAASPDLLLLLVSLVQTRRPTLILECGSGLSSLWFATALRRFDVDGRLVALEHDAQFAEQTRSMLMAHGLAAYVNVRDAPLDEFRLGDEDFFWYDQTAWSDLKDIDLLFVDGPPTDTGHLARYPALPLLSSRLNADPAIVLDDMVRAEEQETLQGWLDDDPNFDVEHVRLEKKAAILTRPAPADDPDRIHPPEHSA